LDFVVDGNSLFRIFQGAGFDVISPIGWLPINEERAAIGRLLLVEPADLPNNRRSLYVCHICGDLGCGAVSVNVEQSASSINWSSFGFENSLSDDLGCLDLDSLAFVGPFAFDSSHYEDVMRETFEEVGRRQLRR
jgi:hypothetical protein